MTEQMDYEPQYVDYVTLFNEGDYGEAHRILTEVWQFNISDTFYKGLIQLAGAFEHWHDGSLFWAEDLLASAHNLLEKHAPECEGLNVDALLRDIRACHRIAIEVRAETKEESGSSQGDDTNDSRLRLEMPSIHLSVKGIE